MIREAYKKIVKKSENVMKECASQDDKLFGLLTRLVSRWLTITWK